LLSDSQLHVAAQAKRKEGADELHAAGKMSEGKGRIFPTSLAQK